MKYLNSKSTPKACYLFVHSTLDDYGLLPSEFRVLGHIARRASSGSAFPSIKSIAQVCRLNEDTVRKALRSLVTRRFLRCEPRQGFTSVYRLNPVSEWVPSSLRGERSEPPPSVAQGSPPSSGEFLPSELTGAEGNPREGHPTKNIHSSQSGISDELLHPLSSGLDAQAVQIYEAYPKRIGKPTALRWIRISVKQYGFQRVFDLTTAFARTCNLPERFIPNPSTFFREERFLDDPATWRRSSAGGGPKAPPRSFSPNNYRQDLKGF